MSNIVYLGTLILLACFMCKPCEAIVGDVTCTNSDPSNCTTYGNAECNTDKCGCKDNFYDSGTTCLSKKNVNDGCSGDGECLSPMTCLSSKCKCSTNEYWTGSTCAAQKNVNVGCVGDGECLSPMTCLSSKCKCSTNEYWTGSTCAAQLELDITCTQLNQTTECVPNAICKDVGSGLKCYCNTGYYDDNFASAGGQCVAELQSGDTCTKTSQSTECVPNAVCLDGGTGPNCTCNSGYFDDNFDDAGGKCVAEIALGAICTVSGSEDECVPSAVCQSVESELKCKCSVGYYDDDVDTTAGTCVKELESGVTCFRANDTTECVPNAMCKTVNLDLKCTCDTGHFDDNFSNHGGKCKADINLGSECTQTNQTTECVSNAECKNEGSGLKCYCSEGYYDSNFADSGGTCTEVLKSGVICKEENKATECVPNAVCKSGVCTCNTGYYDDNFGNPGGLCKAELESGETCTQSDQPTECVPNAACKNFICKCDTGFYDDNFGTTGGKCVPELESGENCTQPDQPTECVPNAACKNSICTCDTGFYDDNFGTTGGKCVAELKPGSICTESNKATECVPYATCTSGGNTGLTCNCNSGYYDSNFAITGGSCILEKESGETCTQADQPTECVPNAVCMIGKCTCINDYYDSNGNINGGTCSLKKDVDENCVDNGPSNQCKDLKSQCTLKSSVFKCYCVKDYYNNAGACTLQTAVGVACNRSQTDECKDPHSSCVPADSGHKCLCNVGYYDYSGTCTIQVSLEDTCTANGIDNQCKDQNAECKDGNGLKCLCKDTFYKDKDKICKQKVALNATCSTGQPSDQCSDPKAECTSSLRCYCQSGYFENSGHVCTKKVLLNNECNSGQSDYQCKDVNSECKMETGTSDTKCLCKNEFYSNTGNICAAKSALGATCMNGEPPAQCSEVNAECIKEATESSVYKCFCKESFYRDDQTCRNLTGLQVENLQVPRDQTGEIYYLIKWTIPATASFINKFQIKITPNNGVSEDLINVDSTESQYNRTNRQPGYTYIIEVISVDTDSRPAEQTTSVTVIAGTRPQVPGQIITTDLLGPQITVSWTISGIIQHLSGVINGSSAMPKAFNLTDIVNGQTPSQSFTSAKNGERYIITVKAYSNGFTSAEYSATIRTTPTKPFPPVIEVCKTGDLLETYMNLRWQEPQVPNGDILYYMISMTGAATRTINTTVSTEVQRIDNLLQQSSYCFIMKTVNDAVVSESDSSQQRCCSTRAGLATLPQNVTFIDIKSRSIKLSWMTPTNIKGKLSGYRVSLTADSVCKVEVVYQCTDCDGAKPIANTECEDKKKVDINSAEANNLIEATIDGLFPYISYDVSIAAVNGKGDGEKNETLVMTDSEVPEVPTNAVAIVKGPKVIQVNWTKQTVKPGNTTYMIKAYEVLDGTDTFVKTITVNGYNTETVDFSGLEEYWEYKFTVTASTIKGPATTLMTAVKQTNQAPPGLVQNLNASRPQNPNNYTLMDVKWQIPKLRERNGDIKEYILKHNISGTMKEETPRTTAGSNNLIETLSVATEQWYKIEVIGVNTIDQEGKIKSIMYYAEPGPPIKPIFSPVTTEVSKAVSTQRTISVELNGDWFFYNKDNGVFTDWGVIVCTGDKCDNYGAGTGTKAGNPFGLGTFKTWKEAQKTGFVEPYRATNNTWIVDRYNAAVGRRKRSSHEVEFMLGEDNDCSKREDTVYCNGPLAPGKSYIIVAFTCTAGGCTESDRFGPFPTQPEPEDVPIAIIAGAAAAVVVFIIVIIIIVVIKKKRNRNQPKKMEEEVEPDFTNPAGLETPSVERKNIKKKRPVKMIDFEAKIAELHKDSNLRFAHEYEELKTLTDPKTMKGVTTFLAETEDNKLKNRYVNILPYDHTIVKLLPLGDDDEEASTFINANYIPGYKSQREYIASQGPIPSTIDDFWRMVWEQSVSIIVMLTLAKEDGRIKCETYWPTEQSEAKQYGDIVVDMQSCSTINTYEFRIFKLTLGDKSRTLKHFHFLNWKDFSANVQNDVMVDFISNVRSHVTIPESRVPMIVHCSAGVGRTGTFIALDHMMQFIRDHDFNSVIDIFDLVVKMRECRMYMVQTEQQYIFIHDCIKDILEKKRQKELEDGEGLYGNVSNQNNQDNIYSNDAFEPDQDLYQNVDMAQPKTEL